jgi:hypothetical protein
VQSTRAIGDLIKPVVKANFGMSMAMFLKENGSTIRLTDMESMFIKTALGMKENGKTTCNTAREKKSGLITRCMRVITTKERNTEKDCTFGRMVPVTKATGSKIELKALAFTNGKTAGRTLVNGKIITCMVKVFTLGLMVEDIKASMKWIKSMATEFTSGLMVVSMKDTG